MANNTIIPDPAKFITAAAQVKTSAAKIKSAFSELISKNKGTSAVWTGEAAELYRALFTEQVPKMESVINNLSAQSDKLSEIGANYKSAENAGTRTAESLPTNVLL